MAGKAKINPKSLQNLQSCAGRLTHEQYVEAGRKGGLKKAENARKRETFRQIIERLGQKKLSKRQKADLAEKFGIDISYIEDASLDVAAIYAAYGRALGGDVDALRYLRDTAGEVPSLALSVGPLDAAGIDMASLSDAEIAAQLDAIDADMTADDGE